MLQTLLEGIKHNPHCYENRESLQQVILLLIIIFSMQLQYVLYILVLKFVLLSSDNVRTEDTVVGTVELCLFSAMNEPLQLRDGVSPR